MVRQLNIEKLKDIELEQKEYQNKIPYEIKYRENYKWDIYYSEIENKYFMMFPTEETRSRNIILYYKKTNRITKK